MADQTPQDTDTGATQAPQFPDKMRVHALAKLLGVTSKQVLAELQGLGRQITSAHSSVERAVAEQVHAALNPVAEPAGQAPEKTPETPAEAPAGFAQPLFLPPSATPAQPAPADPAPQDPVRTAAKPEPVDADADTGDAEDDGDGDGDETSGSSRRRRRRGRRGRGRGRGDQSADESQESDGTEDSRAEDGKTDTGAKSDRGDKADAAGGATKSGTDESGDTAAQKQAADTPTDKQGEQKDDEDGEKDGGEDSGASGSSRRRRRRRRRRTEDGESGDGQTGESADDNGTGSGGGSRRRRRSGGSGAAGGDEVQGITGSTRLEAKRQRRRDGRDAGRRRPPILSESEFLARREAVDRVMVVREKADAHGGEPITQVGVLEDKILVEHFVASDSTPSMVGNIYLGRVQNVLPSMEAAFVDIGRGRNGVLYAGEVDWAAAGLSGSARKIEQALRPGDQVVVQVSKDPVGHKGARLTTQVSMAGRFLVYVPGGNSTGISRKLPDTERKRLKSILRQILPENAGVIIRTAAEGVSEEELTRDIERLSTQWTEIQQHAEAEKKTESTAPRPLYEEPDLLIKVVRDLFNEDFAGLVVEGDRAWETISGYIERVAPELMERVTRFERETPDVDVFGAYRIDEQLAKALDRKVWLPSGGTLVIDRTEAMTVVDVNTGKFTGSGGNLEETVTRNNLEAAEEVVRQMRLRDIGGMIVVDFIDMVLESNRDLVLRRLTEALGRDRTRHQVSEVTSLGLVQMTRKRVGGGLIESFSTSCEHCHGRGLLVHADPIVGSGSGSGSGQSRSKGETRRARRGKGGGGGGAEPQTPSREVPKTEKNPAEHPMFKAMAEHSDDGGDTEPAPKTDKADDGGSSGGQKPSGRGDDRGKGRGKTDRAGKAERGDKDKVAADARSGAQAEPGTDADGKAEALAKIEAAVDKTTGRRRRRRASTRPAGGREGAEAPPTEARPAEQAPAASNAQADRAQPQQDRRPDTDKAASEPQQDRRPDDKAASEPQQGAQSPEPRRRGPRRAARAAAAPAGAPAAAPTPTEQPVRSTVIAPDPATTAATPPPRRPRRRAAGRQAGPPVE